MSDKTIKDENLDEIIKNVVKDIKKGEKFSSQEIDQLMSEANKNLEYTKVISDIKLEAPDNRVIFIDGNEQLLYDNGEFFICDTTDSRKPKRKIKRQEATEIYIEYFIRYQLNPIIEQKNIDNISKTITKSEVKDKVVKVKRIAQDSPKTTSEKSKPSSKRVVKPKDDLAR